MEYFKRYKLRKDGTVEELKVPKSEAIKLITKLLREDREMLKILAKL